MSASRVTLSAFMCFQQFFRFINGLLGKLENWEEAQHFVALELKLKGLPSLWRIVFDATDPDVQATSVNYLNGVFRRASPALQKNSASLRRIYITRVMKHISELCALSQEDSEEHSKSVRRQVDVRILRSIHVLREFVSEYEPRRVLGDSNAVKVRVALRHTQRGGSLTLFGDYYMDDTVGYVRKELAGRINKPVATLYFVTEGETGLRRFYDSEYEFSLQEMDMSPENAVFRFQLDHRLTDVTDVRDFRPSGEEEVL
jgi:hypothetical protein